jgi:cytochrome c-type biogenesis protein CcsB
MSVPQEVLSQIERESWVKNLSLFDWLWTGIVLGGVAFIFYAYGERLDRYEIGVLLGTTAGGIALGLFWKPFRPLVLAVAALSLFALWRYDGKLANAETDFFLRYMLSSQSAVMWMCALFYLATVSYFAGLFLRNEFAAKVGTGLTWVAATMGFVGLLVRWRETFLTDPTWGYVPVSNLYEVFILFCMMTALMYLYYEARYRSRNMGGFVLLVISAAVSFLLWYSFSREAHVIEPLVPALNSWWMKIHVPANFVGYGTFAIAAMLGVAYLLIHYFEKPNRLVAWLAPLGIFFSVGIYVFGHGYSEAQAVNMEVILRSAAYAAIITVPLVLIGWLALTERAQAAMPSREVLEDVMYKSIALGFAFFTIATILGAMWAAEAWGGYWSWDPKETWALIVWLNYAAWLHMRFTKGWRGAAMSWWAVVGLFITTFAFLGVNMFLAGLHSYGGL